MGMFFLLFLEFLICLGGQTIQKQCDQYVKRHGAVMEGQSIVTGAGNLPYKKIIHAVGPHWRGGKDGEADILYDCIYTSVMQTAIDENVKTIAIPAISSGIFGFPLVISTSTIIEAIKDFLNERTYRGQLSEIHLFERNLQRGQTFVNALKKYFEATKPKRKAVRQTSINKKGKYFSV